MEFPINYGPNVVLDIYFNNAWYKMFANDLKDDNSGSTALNWVGPAVNGHYLPYPYINQGYRNRPKFWWMRHGNSTKTKIICIGKI